MLWKSFICVLFNLKKILVRLKLFLFRLMKFLFLFLRFLIRIAYLFLLVVQLLVQNPTMKSETKSKIWSAIIAAAVSLLTSIAQIFS
jgi:hypothetical protein